MSADKVAYYGALGDIETYLGYLRGNELALDYLHKALLQNNYGDRPEGAVMYPVFLDEDYRFPCPDGRFAVQPLRPFFRFEIWVYADPDNLPDQSPAEYVKQLQAGADQAWRTGAAWASGIANYAGSLCERFMTPDVDALAGAVRDLQLDVVHDLDLPAHTDWANIGTLLSDWHGAAKGSFGPFYSNYSSALTSYDLFGGFVTAGVAAATRILVGTQNGAVKFVETLRDGMTDQLDEWVARGLKPTDPPKTPPWVADVVQIGKDAYSLLDHVPVVKDVKSEVDKGISITQSIEAIAIDLGWEPPKKEKPFDAQDSEELYHELVDTLNVDYYQAWEAAMDSKVEGKLSDDPELAGQDPFSADRVIEQLNEQKRRLDWDLPAVKDDSLYSPDSHYRY